jgi:hypothetical protein
MAQGWVADMMAGGHTGPVKQAFNRMKKSFLVRFFKKEPLPYFLAQRLHIRRSGLGNT